MSKTEEMITITKEEYDMLNESFLFLSALEMAGVDNWDGYEIAQNAMEDSEETE